MHVVTLISATRLDPAFVDALRNAWGGGDAIWLHETSAAEFRVTAVPDNQWNVWAEAQKMGVDLVIQPEKGRRKSVLIADMDSTMIGQECIDELADVAGVGVRVKDITARAMNGELDFEDALRERVSLLKGLSTDIITRVWQDRITLTPGGPELLATMRRDGAYCALVSGGFTQFTKRVAERLGFDEHRANTLIEANGTLTGAVGSPILGRDAKVSALEEICAMRGVRVSDAMAVGDGANDLGMLHLAGAGVALHAKPIVAAEVDRRINHGDLTALLYLQGYSADEFAIG
ncbi:Phosphoserine phosphatase [Rhodobacteraceae bacterium THAF1]|uniref:phosphoserine phosphatase SerB n=1 Tax=Palleronia sp. THAF1 TaxID=2587842 RepID=UPI000F3FE8D1|nr:phosphoserine phosphatase SerB [Palleronia sp. THAF1]QFU07279.1 Phosphoserine phosphatase [Palleronia sp. THAF1]VDC20809.1 Phosphoserine phosphatase [Rhodobacteraceae bacterium THAF1]